MATRVNKKEALQIIERVVKRHGEKTTYAKRDRTYAKTKYATGHGGTLYGGTCRYVNTKGKPMCIVGVALVEEMAVDPATLDYEGAFCAGVGCETAYGLYGHRPELRKRLTPAAARVFQAAQDAQDSDLPWGEALKAAAEAAK